MKRPAICLFVWIAVVGWATTGHAKKGGGKGAADTQDTAEAAAPDPNASGDTAKPSDSGDQQAATPAPESLETDLAGGGKVEEELTEVPPQRPTSVLSWKDIVTVPRKAFLKGGRLELAPFAGISVNDNLIRHYMVGGDINYFLTDVIWIGLEGQYFIKQLTNQDDLVGLQYNRTPTLNRYLYGGALNFGYVPIYGKFALFNRSILHWEIWASAGVGVTFTEVIPRDPANASLAFKNTDLTPNVGVGTRFFLFDWMTINVALRDYIVPDKFEHDPNPPINPADPTMTAPYANAAAAKADATSALVNNLMFYAGVGFYLPTKFNYKTPQ